MSFDIKSACMRTRFPKRNAILTFNIASARKSRSGISLKAYFYINLFISFALYTIPSYLPYPLFRDREHNPAINVEAFKPLPEDADETYMSYGPGGTSIKPIQLNRVHKSLQNWSCNARIKAQHTPQSSRQPDGGQNSPSLFARSRGPRWRHPLGKVIWKARETYLKRGHRSNEAGLE